MARETKEEKIERLASEAWEMDAEIDYIADNIRQTVKKINQMKPTPEQIDKYDLTYFFNEYLD